MSRNKYYIADPTPGLKTDLTDQVFHHLTVIRKYGLNKHNNVVWLCACVCGNFATATTTYLKSGKKKSCGCKHYKKGSAVYNWSGCGELPGSYMCQLRQGAASRKLNFNISACDIWELFLMQDRRCALTGIPLVLSPTMTASLDRIDSKLHYDIENVQWVHKDVNVMRNHFSIEYFVNICRAVSNLMPEDSSGKRIIANNKRRLRTRRKNLKIKPCQ